MASNIEIQEEDDDEEEDDEVNSANVETRTGRHKHPQRTRPVRRGRRYRLVGLGLGLLCGVQALLNIGLRLSLYSDLIEENNNLTKDLEQMTNQKDDLQFRYDNVTAELDELKRLRLCELSGWKTFGSSCYYISTWGTTWKRGREYCRENKADLIIINSKEEQDFVNRVVNKDQWVWLGLTDMEEEGVWTWVDGTPLTSPTYWINGEPNDAGEGEDCALHNYGGTGKKGWSDSPCTWTRPCICEKVL